MHFNKKYSSYKETSACVSIACSQLIFYTPIFEWPLSFKLHFKLTYSCEPVKQDNPLNPLTLLGIISRLVGDDDFFFVMVLRQQVSTEKYVIH